MGPKRRPLVSVPLSAANVAIAAARKEAQELGYTQGYADAVAKMQAEAAELRALREVAEAARAFVPEQARVLLGFGKIHPLTRLDSRVAALVDALAKVPR